MPTSEARFERHEYGKVQKRSVKQVSDFDPRPAEFRRSAVERLPSLLDAVRGQGLCISLLLDPKTRYWTESSSLASSSTPTQPTLSCLKETISAFKESLWISEETIRKIEQDTQDQRHSSQWFSVQRYHITSSMFGTILRHRDDTPPDSLVVRILQQKQLSSAATTWGVQNEARAVQQYICFQHAHGHDNVMVTPSGFLISKQHPFLGASPDGAVYDPTNTQEPFGFLEVKCPFSNRNETPEQASTSPGFCSILHTDSDGMQQLKLRRTYTYYAQVQGQMAIGARPWCDFVIFTTLAWNKHRKDKI